MSVHDEKQIIENSVVRHAGKGRSRATVTIAHIRRVSDYTVSTELCSVQCTSGSPKLNPHLALGRRYVDLESTGSVPGAGDIGPVFRDLTVSDKAFEGF